MAVVAGKGEETPRKRENSSPDVGVVEHGGTIPHAAVFDKERVGADEDMDKFLKKLGKIARAKPKGRPKENWVVGQFDFLKY